MPDEYKGEVTTNCGYTKTAPRKWTEREIAWVQQLLQEGYTVRDIATSTGRSEASVSIKTKRLTKMDRSYNADHLQEKKYINQEFLRALCPKTILDVYSGPVSSYKDYDVITNDKNANFDCNYNLDALDFLCLMQYQGVKADLVDLDPFGSAYDCFDLAIKIARKGLVLTFGELGHKRFKRLDFVQSHYGITKMEDFTLDALIEHVKMIAARNKKTLTVFAKREWRNIGRVWFYISPLKVTSQWEKEG